MRIAVRLLFIGWMLAADCSAVELNACGFSSIQEQQEGEAEKVAGAIQNPGQAVHPPEPVDEYMGRRVAQTMHYAGAEWLIRDEREREERCSMMLTNLGLQRGMTVCDMGCGNGFYSLPIARLVGEEGQVLAVDIQSEMLVYLRDRMETSGINNISPILGSAWDPHLPAGTVDLCLMVDVYHEFSHPEPMLAAIRRSLSAEGVVVLAEYRAEDPDVPIKPLHKMSKEQVDREMVANGFRLKSSFEHLPWQHLLFYERAPDWHRDALKKKDSKESNKPDGENPNSSESFDK